MGTSRPVSRASWRRSSFFSLSAATPGGREGRFLACRGWEGWSSWQHQREARGTGQGSPGQPASPVPFWDARWMRPRRDHEATGLFARVSQGH